MSWATMLEGWYVGLACQPPIFRFHTPPTYPGRRLDV
jgi:hypothetical protein